MWAWLAEFIGRILRHVLPALFEEMKKPKDVTMAGGDDEVRNDIDNDITSGLHP